MLFRRRIIAVFLTVQLVGISCSWLWQHVSSAISSLGWGVALVTLLPGNFLSAWIVENLFWQSALSLLSMGIASTFLLFTINAIFWLATVMTIQVLRAHLSRRPDVPASSTPKPTRS